MVTLTRENRSTPKTATVTVRPLQIAHGLAYDRIRTSALEFRRLTTWVIMRP